MPYASNSDLPDNVRGVLPRHAQDIYREAFNSAWDQYADPEERRDGHPRGGRPQGGVGRREAPISQGRRRMARERLTGAAMPRGTKDAYAAHRRSS